MRWEKLGLIFDIRMHNLPWLKSHALLPTPLLLENQIRIFYTGRDLNGQSRISYIDVERHDPKNILYVHEKPLLDIGKIGTFDDCGTVGTSAVQNEECIFLYYNGYNVRNTVPWSNAIGVAISYDNGMTFKKMFEGPIMDRNRYDSYFTITPGIYREKDVWHMWYTSGTGWKEVNGRQEPLYVIKYAKSSDGLVWNRENIICIKESTPEEANARATVVKEGEILKMWFCYRGSRDFRDGVDSYRIGYAEASVDEPTRWLRNDSLAGISLGPEEFDCNMQAYPAVIDVDNQRFLFYSGNGFGAFGICCAVWK
jgi:hypothetical protein